MGNSNPKVTIPFLVNLVNQGKLKVLDSIVKTYSPDQINQAIHDAEKGEYFFSYTIFSYH